ncbi:LamG domain-containing protein [Allomuricauda sp.]|uniref:LamG domain-containing protein n=1 Tax=Flagellimonas alginolytica TaxID=3177515 RepID=UPI0025D6F224|nr:LamG domain-containing protein [Allomuricauda sp.]
MKTPKSIGGLIYGNHFDSLEASLNKKSESGIHKKSICFSSKDSTLAVFNKKLEVFSEMSMAMWFQPDFYGRNGTIINLSKEEKDFPIKSILSLFMNKNRVGVMQQGKDLRKESYINQRGFTKYFMSLAELKPGDIYFLAYIFSENKVRIYIDGKEYAIFDHVPNLHDVNYTTLGASWNNQGSKYHFNGCMDDLYIYNKALSEEEIYNLMDYTHVYQYAK